MKKYPVRPLRPRVMLDGVWQLQIDGKTTLAAVPGCFDSHLDNYNRRGEAVYRQTVNVAADGNYRLHFEGAGLYAEVYWDGQLLGKCVTPYTPFAFDIAAGAGHHQLSVLIDNRFSRERTPLFYPFFDFYGYGGIYRSVYLQKLPAKRLEQVKITTRDYRTGAIELDLAFVGVADGKLPISIAFDHADGVEFEAEVKAGHARLTLMVPHHRVWSPESPDLHEITVDAGFDVIVDRFGIRTVRAANGKIYLNDKAVYLHGVNRHESHPVYGAAMPLNIALEDVKLMKSLNCNFVRLVHYEQSGEILELCDEVGLLAWAESLGWQNPPEDLQNPEIVKLLTHATAQLVENNFNHPSVIIWAFLNESCSQDERGVDCYRQLAATVRQHDPTRLVSFASDKNVKDLCLQFADVVSFNFYPGWFSDLSWDYSSFTPIKPALDRLAAFADREDLKDKPLIMSEIGTTALYGLRDPGMAQWSEDFQSHYLETVLDAVFANPRFTGIAIWQFGDAKSYVNVGEIRGKVRGYNCAGLVDEYRRCKLSFFTVKDKYGKHAAATN